MAAGKFYPPRKESTLNDTLAGTGFELGLRWEKQNAQRGFGIGRISESKISCCRLGGSKSVARWVGHGGIGESGGPPINFRPIPGTNTPGSILFIHDSCTPGRFLGINNIIKGVCVEGQPPSCRTRCRDRSFFNPTNSEIEFWHPPPDTVSPGNKSSGNNMHSPYELFRLGES